MFGTMMTRLILARQIRAVTRLSLSCTSVQPTFDQYAHVRHCVQRMVLAARHIRSGPVPSAATRPVAADTATLSELQARLSFDSHHELRLFWRRTGAQLEQSRATNALHVLTQLDREGIGQHRVKDHPRLLLLSRDRLALHMYELRKLSTPLRLVFPLLLLRSGQLLPAVATICADAGLFPGADSRLDFLVCQLQVDYTKLCTAAARSPYLLTLSADRLAEITLLMIEGGMGADAILDDLWIYKHNIDVMKERMRWLQEVQLQPLRPWMLRCPQYVLHEHIKRFQLRLEILSHCDDEVSYLSERLGLRRVQVSAFEQRYPPALRVSVMKMKAVLDVLLSSGFTGSQVDEQPRILCYSAARIQQRCERLRAAGLRPSSLLVLCKTPKDFDRYIAAATSALDSPPAPSTLGRDETVLT